MKELLSPEIINLVFVGALAAVVHAFTHLVEFRKNGMNYTWKDFVVYTIFGGFAGVMFGIAAQWLFKDDIARLFFTGMGGFTGFAGLNALSMWALNKLGVSAYDNEKKN